MKVTLTLDKPTAEKLRALCHARGKTASEIVTEWVEKHANSSRLTDSVMDILRKAGLR